MFVVTSSSQNQPCSLFYNLKKTSTLCVLAVSVARGAVFFSVLHLSQVLYLSQILDSCQVLCLSRNLYLFISGSSPGEGVSTNTDGATDEFSALCLCANLC